MLLLRGDQSCCPAKLSLSVPLRQCLVSVPLHISSPPELGSQMPVSPQRGCWELNPGSSARSVRVLNR